MNSEQKEKTFLPAFLVSLLILFVNIYWYAIDIFDSIGWLTGFMQETLGGLYRSGVFSSEYKTKFWALVFVTVSFLMKGGRATEKSWTVISIFTAVSLAMFLFPLAWARMSLVYMFTTVTGFVMYIFAVIYISKKINPHNENLNDLNETFDQCTKLMKNDDSINIPIVFQYKHKKRKGWINVVNPFRPSMVLGIPGSGKSFSVYNPFIEQMIKKGYTMFLYDYKFPDLTEEVYNQFMNNQDVYRKMYGKIPKFCVLNFDDPLYSHRCNPLDPRYITDPADTAEIADLIMRNINPKSNNREDFFTLSAKAYIDSLIWFLRIHQNGRYCTFPHLIELMGRNYKAVFKMLIKYPEIKTKIQPFMNALKGNAQEQLQGQIASAQIPMARFSSPAVYYVLSGNDFALNINNPDDPKILCVGNNPDRQSIYGTTLALYTSRMFKEINHKGKIKCGVLLDELPTIFIKGLDNLCATARSNKVAIVLGAQSKDQLVRDYTKEEAEVIFTNVGNFFAGQTNGHTAKEMSEMFGREYREQMSETIGADNNSINMSYQQRDILPQSRIETMSQGYFFGKVADSNESKITKKLFCGEVQIDLDKYKKTHDKSVWKTVPPLKEDEFGLKRIDDTIMKNKEACCIEYLVEKTQDKEMEESRDDFEHYNFTPESVIRRDAKEKYDKMKTDEREELLKKVIERARRKAINRIIKENYDKICTDIDDIFAKEEVPEYDNDEEDEKDKNNNNNGHAGVNSDPNSGTDMNDTNNYEDM